MLPEKRKLIGMENSFEGQLLFLTKFRHLNVSTFFIYFLLPLTMRNIYKAITCYIKNDFRCELFMGEKNIT